MATVTTRYPQLLHEVEDKDIQGGRTMQRVLLVPYSDRDRYEPRLGTLLPGSGILRVSHTRFEGEGAGDNGEPEFCRLTVDYAEYPHLDSGLLWRSSMASEMISTGLYWKRLYADILNVDPENCVTVASALKHYTCRKVVAEDPDGPKLNAGLNMSCINGGRWRPTVNSPIFQPETLLFVGCESNQWFDEDRNCYLWAADYNFVWRPYSWNIDLFSPIIDGARNIIVAGGWDVLYVPGKRDPITGTVQPYKYRRTDFNPMLGLPAQRFFSQQPRIP